MSKDVWAQPGQEDQRGNFPDFFLRGIRWGIFP